jgi:hypothetical protein
LVLWFLYVNTLEQQTKILDIVKTNATMADVTVFFSMFWTGSNQQIASRVAWCYDPDNVDAEAFQLQSYAARLVGAKSLTCIKITLGSPGGPQLTRPLLLRPRPLTSIDGKARNKALVAAWSSLHPGQVANVFVTQHSQAALAIHSLCSKRLLYGFDTASEYSKLPLDLQRNPSVALAALEVQDTVNMPHSTFLVDLPSELKSNKKFALAALGRVGRRYCVFVSIDDELRKDEDIALALVAKHHDLMLHLPLALRSSRDFVLKAVSVNGKCISYAPAHLKKDKAVGLAAARQCRAAFWCLAAELRCDDDIKQAHETHSTTQPQTND